VVNPRQGEVDKERIDLEMELTIDGCYLSMVQFAALTVPYGKSHFDRLGSIIRVQRRHQSDSTQHAIIINTAQAHE
jgi:hypothetical protein